MNGLINGLKKTCLLAFLLVLFAVSPVFGADTTLSAGDISGVEQVTAGISYLEITPVSADVLVEDTVQLTATAYDSDGQETSCAGLIWESSDETVGTVDSAGFFTALSPGTSTVTAFCGDFTSGCTITVAEAESEPEAVTETETESESESGNPEDESPEEESSSENYSAEDSPSVPEIPEATAEPTQEPTPEPTAEPKTITEVISSISAEESFGGVIPGVNDVYLTVANDEGLRFNDFGNDTFCVDWSSGGGLNALHIAESSGGYGEVTNTDAMSGIFYATETGGKAYHDEVYLCVAVNGTISDDFRLHITSDGPRWTPGSTAEAEYVTSTIDEWFYKDDFIYGPQTWKPAAGIQYPIFPGHDVTDASNTFEMMFIDLNAGTLDSQSLKIQYEIENLNSMLAFAVYGYRKNDDGYYNLTGFTNRLTGIYVDEYSGWYVYGTPLPDAASVVIEPVSVEVPLNGNQQFTATAKDAEGIEINGAPIIWTSSNTGVGTIDDDGLFTPVSEGSTIITATSGSVSQTSAVTVIPEVEKVLTTITLDPDSVSMYVDQIENVQFTATGYDQFGYEFSADYTWSSTVPVVGSINETGFFTAKAEGTTEISATSGDVSQTATVEIKQHPDWDVTLIGAINRTLSRSDIIDLASGGLISCTDNKEIFWEGVNLTSVLALFDDDDPFSFNTTLANLDYNITIKGKKSGEEHSVLITSLELVDNEKTFVAAYKMDGHEIPETTVSGRTYWPLKLTGTAILNTGRNVEEISNITIEFPPAVKRIDITSDSVITFAGGKTIQFAATAYDSADIELKNIPFTWSVSDSSIGTIDADGLFTPLKAGTVDVIATYKSVSRSVAVTVLSDSGAKTWTVDQSGSGDFTTIPGAVDYAREGDTIIVHDGIYKNGQFVIDKGITLKSVNGYESTVIEDHSTDGFLIAVTANNVKISGFNLSGKLKASEADDGTLLFSGVNNCEISENLFPSMKGIIGSSLSDSVIENNHFVDYGYLNLDGVNNNIVIRDNVVDNSYSKAFMIDGSNIGIYNNSITSTSSSCTAINFGICDNVIVSGNVISTAIGVQSGSASCNLSSAKIINNTIHAINYPMVLYKNGNDVEIADNWLDSEKSGLLRIRGPINNICVHHNYFSDTEYSYYFYLRDCDNSLNLYANSLNITQPQLDGKGILNYDLSTLNSTVQYTYVYNGETYTDFIGNSYNIYNGTDSDGNGFGDTPFEEDGVYDYSPLVSPTGDYLVLEASSINVTPSTATLKVGESTEFSASAIDQRGLDFPQAVFAFSSSDPSVGTVDSSTGRFEALSHGTVTVIVSSGDAIGTAEVTVEKVTEKEESTNFAVANCTIKGNGKGGSSVCVNSSSATVVNNSICMQGNGFNLTIRTSSAPVVNGSNVEGDVENIVLETIPVTADLQTPGNVSAGISLNLTDLPTGAGITTTITEDIDSASQSAFQLAASEDGLNVNAVAYTMNIVKTNLANGADIKEATIRMAVSHAWIAAHGGTDSVKIIRFAEDGTKEVLDTVCVGTEGDMDVFEALSPNGLSIFGLAATGTPSSGSSTGSSSSGGGGSSSIGTARIDKVAAGETGVFTLGETAITSVEVVASAEIPEMMLTSEKVSVPSGIDAAPGEVYQYIEIEEYLAPEGSMKMATLKFSVDKDWLSSIGSLPSGVKIYRYDEDSETWELLSTVENGETDSGYRFFADTPSFSLFAITAEKGASSPVSSEAAPSASEPDSGINSGPQTNVEQTVQAEKPANASGFSSVFLLIAVFAIIAVCGVVYRFKKAEKK